MIDLKIDDGIAVVTIAHGKANVLDVELCEALTKCFEELRASDVKAVVITGQGRMFSAGVDLVRVSSGGADYVRKLLPVMNRMFDAVFFLPKPVVAAVNGHAIAGGCVLTCCADRRLMARGGGRIGVTELLVGVPFPALAFEIVRATVPPRHLAEFTVGGATYEADEALSRGWVDEIMEADALMANVMAAAHRLASLSPVAFAHTKAQMRQPIIERLERSGVAIDKIATEIWVAVETLGHIRDYVARTLKKA